MADGDPIVTAWARTDQPLKVRCGEPPAKNLVGGVPGPKTGVGQKDQKYKALIYFRVNSGCTVSST
jgi:hypothetical protein